MRPAPARTGRPRSPRRPEDPRRRPQGSPALAEMPALARRLAPASSSGSNRDFAHPSQHENQSPSSNNLGHGPDETVDRARGLRQISNSTSLDRIPHVPRRDAQHRGECRAILPRGSLGSNRRPLCLGLSGDDRQPVRRFRAAVCRATGTSPTRRARSRRCAAPAWSASSRNSIPATATSTPRAARSRRRRGSWSGTTRCATQRGEIVRDRHSRLFARHLRTRTRTRELRLRPRAPHFDRLRTPPGRTR